MSHPDADAPVAPLEHEPPAPEPAAPEPAAPVPPAPDGPDGPDGPDAAPDSAFDPTRPPGPPPFWAYRPDQAPTPPPPTFRPRWRRARRACTVLAVVGVLLVLASGVVAVQSYRDAGTPAAAVRAYFGALARGDAAGALGSGQVPGGGRALVSADVLRATLATAPIEDVTTGTVRQSGGTASVAVRYRLGGSSPQQVDDTVALVRVDGRWELRRTAVPLSLSVTDASSWAAVPGRRPFQVPLDSQLVFPGAVPVAYRTPLVEVAPESRVVRLDSTVAFLGLAAQVTQQGRAQVTRTLVSALTACVAGGTDSDPFCPQPDPGRADGAPLRAVPRSFTGTVQELDRLQPDVGVATDPTGTLTLSGTVAVGGKWQVLDYDNTVAARSGQASLVFLATVPVGAPGTLTWGRS